MYDEIQTIGVPGTPPGGNPTTPAEATAMVLAGLDWLATAKFAEVPAAEQAECLRALERASSVHLAARSAVLSAFDAVSGHQDDGHGTARTWLRWQTRITDSAASAATGWMRRLAAHAAVRDALAVGAISVSWARQICDWTDQLPASARDDADLILLAAAAGGVALADLANLADQMRRNLAPADPDGKDDFDDRQLRLQTTIGGAGHLDGDLTPRCAEAIQAVLDALGKRTGPEDTRTKRQRDHDALEEACRRLISAGGLPDRAGQPTQIQLHISLEDLARRLSDPAGSDRSGLDSPAAAGHAARSGWPRLIPDGSQAPGPALPGAAAMPGDQCDATIVPIVTGHLDLDLLDQLTSTLVRLGEATHSGQTHSGQTHGGQQHCDQVRELIAANAVALLSGPAGLASYLRTGQLTGPAASISLPLDLGRSTDTIPPHLRRAVIERDQHCAAPGCLKPPSSSQVHHIRPRSQGGATSLSNLVLLCSFHHLILIHQWGWTITLNPDGTTTTRSPDGNRVYHSHGPPAVAA